MSKNDEFIEKIENVSETIIPTNNETSMNEEMQALVRKIDRESAYRVHTCWKRFITIGISILFVAFQIFATLSGMVTAQILRSIHLAFVMLLCFLLFPATKNMRRDTLPLYDVVLGVVGALAWLYIAYNFEGLVRRTGAYTKLDIFVGVIGIVVLFEACRRVVGIPIMIIAGTFIIYAFAGPYLPGFLNHRGYSFKRVVSHLFFNTEGIMGTPIGACSTFIFLFIFFGALLEKTGIGQFFIDVCKGIAGASAGGPAKVAVLASALLGTVSGSSVSNTVGSGSFTIPMMKKLGYKSEFSGAVEASASTGGQLMPPIMGAAAFLMAESLAVPYLQIAKAAIIPAVLYFTGIFMMVHLEARKLGLKGMSKSELPRVMPLLVKKGYLIIPLFAIIFFLTTGKTPTYAALMGIVSAAGLGLTCSVVDIIKGRKPTFVGKDVVETICTGARNIISVAVACGMAGIIIGIVTLTGLGLKLGAGLISLSNGIDIVQLKILVTLFLTMIASIILGMGSPTTANYLITSTITAPALIMLKVNPIAAHMFAFYFGIIADITPPVALAAIAGAAIAKGKPIATAVQSTKLSIAAFLIPYMFVFSPQMLLINASTMEIVTIILSAMVGMFGLSASLEGWALRKCNVVERVLLAVAGLLLIVPEVVTDISGLVVIVAVIIIQFFHNKIELKTGVTA